MESEAPAPAGNDKESKAPAPAGNDMECKPPLKAGNNMESKEQTQNDFELLKRGYLVLIQFLLNIKPNLIRVIHIVESMYKLRLCQF